MKAQNVTDMPCPRCHGPDTEIVNYGKGFRLWRCSHCGPIGAYYSGEGYTYFAFEEEWDPGDQQLACIAEMLALEDSDG